MSESYEEISDFLYEEGLECCVQDFWSYLGQRQEHLEEGESPGVIVHSLQSWAWFMADCAKPLNLPCTRFFADFDGCVELEWRLSDMASNDKRENDYWGEGEGIAVLRFYPSRMHVLSLLSGPFAEGRRRIEFEGCLSYGKTKEILTLFAGRFLGDEDETE